MAATVIREQMSHLAVWAIRIVSPMSHTRASRQNPLGKVVVVRRQDRAGLRDGREQVDCPHSRLCKLETAQLLNAILAEVLSDLAVMISPEREERPVQFGRAGRYLVKSEQDLLDVGRLSIPELIAQESTQVLVFRAVKSLEEVPHDRRGTARYARREPCT